MRIEHSRDIEVVAGLAQRWKEESNVEDFGLEVSVDDFKKDLENWFQMCAGTLILAYEETELVGFFAVFAIKNLLGRQMMGLEKYWYVVPERSVVAPLMFKEAQQWSKQNGCSHLISTASNATSRSHDRLCQFYLTMGMRLFETSFIMEI